MMPAANFLYVVVIAFALGVLLRSFYEVGLEEAVFVALMGLVVAWSGGKTAKGGFTPALFIGITIFVFALGITRMEMASWNEVVPYFESQLGKEVTFEGTIAREPDLRASNTHLYVKTAQGLVLVVAERGPAWNYGDHVRVTGEIKIPEPFQTDLGREFNYRGYLLAKGVTYMVPQAEVQKIRAGEGNPALAVILKSKQAFMTKLESLIPEPEAGLSLGLLLGVKRALGDDLEKAFRRSGIIHIVVLSGYNLMIVATFILYVLGGLFGRRFAAILGIGGILLFALMVGLSATVVRASIMAVLLLLMGLTGRVYMVLRGLFVAGLLMIVSNPYALAFDVGFQLSFLATLGLVIFSPYLKEKLEFVPDKFVSAREFLTATLATQLFVLPILLYQIGEFSMVAVIVNILVLPMVPLAMLLSFFTGLAAFIFTPIASVLAFATYLSLTYIITLAEWFSSLPMAAIAIPPFPFWLVPAGYAVIAYLVWRLQQKSDELKEA